MACAYCGRPASGRRCKPCATLIDQQTDDPRYAGYRGETKPPKRKKLRI